MRIILQNFLHNLSIIYVFEHEFEPINFNFELAVHIISNIFHCWQFGIKPSFCIIYIIWLRLFNKKKYKI